MKVHLFLDSDYCEMFISIVDSPTLERLKAEDPLTNDLDIVELDTADVTVVAWTVKKMTPTDLKPTIMLDYNLLPLTKELATLEAALVAKGIKSYYPASE